MSNTIWIALGLDGARAWSITTKQHTCRLLKTDAVLYQGTPAETDVTFSGYRFATKNADSRTHYAIKRSVEDHSLGTINKIEADQYDFPEGYLSRQVVINVATDFNSDASLLRSTGERVD